MPSYVAIAARICIALRFEMARGCMRRRRARADRTPDGRVSSPGKIEFLARGKGEGRSLLSSFLCRSPEGIHKFEIYDLFPFSLFTLPFGAKASSSVDFMAT